MNTEVHMYYWAWATYMYLCPCTFNPLLHLHLLLHVALVLTPFSVTNWQTIILQGTFPLPYSISINSGNWSLIHTNVFPLRPIAFDICICVSVETKLIWATAAMATLRDHVTDRPRLATWSHSATVNLAWFRLTNKANVMIRRCQDYQCPEQCTLPSFIQCPSNYNNYM